MIRELLKYQQNNFTYVAFCLIQQTVKYIGEIMKSFISVYILALFLGLVESIVYLCYTSSKDHLFLKKKRYAKNFIFNYLWAIAINQRDTNS